MSTYYFVDVGQPENEEVLIFHPSSGMCAGVQGNKDGVRCHAGGERFHQTLVGYGNSDNGLDDN